MHNMDETCFLCNFEAAGLQCGTSELKICGKEKRLAETTHYSTGVLLCFREHNHSMSIVAQQKSEK